MTLFTKDDCKLCDQLKNRFDLKAMNVRVEVLDRNNADALAHLAWHGLVETARKTLPLLVLDDFSAVAEFPRIEGHLVERANQCGVAHGVSATQASCGPESCAL